MIYSVSFISLIMTVIVVLRYFTVSSGRDLISIELDEIPSFFNSCFIRVSRYLAMFSCFAFWIVVDDGGAI